ncbi:mitochondrial import inner membrane translocase subunit TIM50-like [Juglans microcarpa x Juglans regia]|uniref:mitochondrial import inner membrane translocase subunit TIM50-like n=1 Tax=Juglans microcarpa x Juglans regia TaxID=2249226 RepID=UPI001B7F64C0|nr:mitochondrial import inner membrane translocase subunit TIM50-like [Juglans microcarpa x Juglans regia]
MSFPILRSRLASLLTKHHRRPLSSDVQPFASSPASAAAVAPPPPNTTTDTPLGPFDASVSSSNKGWRFLKYGLIVALTGATATAGYASYAYTLDDIDVKTRALRSSVNFNATDDASAVEKFKGLLNSAAMTVPAKAIELYLEMGRLIEEQVQSFAEPYAEKLLPDLHPAEQHVFTLVLDLQETLIHYDWTREKGWQTLKRPGVDAFLEHLAQFYEIVIYSDEQSMFVDPVVERLDPKHCIRYRLSKGATKYQNGNHYRDLSKLNRNPGKILYLSGHALEGCLQPENCVPVKPWKQHETDDTALLDFIPFLEFVARTSPPDIRPVLASYQGCEIPTEFIRRSKDYQRRMEEQKQHGRLWKR